VPKTGGSTVTEVLQHLPGWDFLGRPRSGQPRFFAAYGDLFDGTPAIPSVWRIVPSECRKYHPNASAIEGSGCGGLHDWRRRRIVIDFHEPTGLGRFHGGLLPRLGKLRERYAAAGCAMAVGTVLREPMSQMLSEFLYFHVQFNAKLQGNATLQESTFVERWLRGRANPQLAWMRGRSCRMIGAIFLCNTPPTEACGHSVTSSSTADGSSSQSGGSIIKGVDDVPIGGTDAQTQVREANATAVAIAKLQEFDVVGTSGNVGQIMWALAARVGYFLNETTVWRGKDLSAKVNSPHGSSSGGGGAGGIGSSSDIGEQVEHAPTVGAVFRCNPPGRGGRLSLSMLSASTLRELRAHSRCDRLLYEAALLREREEFAFTSQIARRLSLPGIGRHAPTALPPSTGAAFPPPESLPVAQPLQGAARGLYESGGARRVAVNEGLAALTGRSNVDISLLGAVDRTQLAPRLEEFHAAFACKVAGSVETATEGTQATHIAPPLDGL